MVDIFDEVNEDLRAERAEKLAKKYAPLVAALALAIVAGVAGWQWWERRLAQQDAAAAARFVAAETALGRANADKSAQMPVLDQLATNAPEGYKQLARLRAAAVRANAGDLKDAVALWNSVAADASADPLLRDFASLMAASREIDHGDPANIEARLKPLAEPDSPWSSLAREQLALLDLRQGKTDEARKQLQALATETDVPPGLRTRVNVLLTSLGPQEKK